MIRFSTHFTKVIKQSQTSPLSFFQRKQPQFYFSADQHKDNVSSNPQQNQSESSDRLNIFRQSLMTTGIAVTATHFASVSTAWLGPVLLFPIGGYFTYRYLYKLERNSIFEYFQELRQANDAQINQNIIKVVDFFEKILIERFGQVEKLDDIEKQITLGKLVLSIAAFTSIFHVFQSYLLVLTSGMFFYSAYQQSQKIFQNQQVLNDNFKQLKWCIFKIGLPNYLLNLSLGFVSFGLTGNVDLFSPVSTLLFSTFWTWGLYRLMQESDTSQQSKVNLDSINLSITPFYYITQQIDIEILLNQNKTIQAKIKEQYLELKKILNI